MVKKLKSADLIQNINTAGNVVARANAPTAGLRS